MPGAAHEQASLLGVEHEIDEGRVASGLELAEQVVEPLDHVRGRGAVHRVGAEAAAELTHQRRGVEAPAGHVPDRHAQSAARQREGVEPVAAELCRRRRQVAALESHARHLGQRRHQAGLDRVGQPALALVQPAPDRERSAVAGAHEQLHVVVGEDAVLERAHVEHADHGALHDQRHPEQRLDALLAQQRVDELGVLEIGDAHRLARAGDPAGEPLAHPDADTALHLLLEALRCARDERAPVVLQQQDRGRIDVEDLDDAVEQLVQEPL